MNNKYPLWHKIYLMNTSDYFCANEKKPLKDADLNFNLVNTHTIIPMLINQWYCYNIEKLNEQMKKSILHSELSSIALQGYPFQYKHLVAYIYNIHR